MPSGDYTEPWRIYGGSVVDIDLPTVNPAVIAAKSATRIVAVQKITFTPSTYAAATLTFTDSLTGTVIGVINVPATAPAAGDGSNMFQLDYGPRGTKLTAGANLNMSVSAGGAVGRLHVEGYQKGR